MIESPSIWFTIIAFFLLIGPLVFVHEMGHYLAARSCRVRCDTFSIGFGREVTGWTDRRGMRWKVGWMPLGGYVKFAGDLNAASFSDPESSKLPESEKRDLFQFRPVWQRFYIVAAGPLINFLFAIVIYVGIFAGYGMPQTPAVVSSLVEDSVAEQAGFELGDRIVGIDGRTIERFDQLAEVVMLRPGQMMSFEIERGSESLVIDAAPAETVVTDRFGNEGRIGRMGIGSNDIEFAPVPILQLPGAAVERTWANLEMIVVGLKQIILGQRSIRELGGPLRIAQISGQQASLGILSFFFLMALISVNLGFINLLPIPMLDGGHLVFYAAEAVRRKPVGPEAQEWAYRMGLAVLLGFMVMVTFIDLGSFGLWERLGSLIG